MIADSVTTTLQVIFLALTPSERWNAASSPLHKSFAIGEWLPVLAVIAQIVSLIVVFSLVSKKRRLEHHRKLEIARLVSAKEELQKTNDDLAATNEELRQEVFELTQRIPAEALEQMSALHGSAEAKDHLS